MDPSLERSDLIGVADGALDSDLRRRVGALLAEGAIVALPTETVYGLAARADDDLALARLAELKGTTPDRGWTWHVGARGAIETFGALRPLAARLAERYWPGPLTLVLSGIPPGLERVAREGWTGVRMPAHGATQDLLAALDFPVVMTSANRAGEAPATDAAPVHRTFGSELALVLDGGPSRLAESSGVLRVGPATFELLREGLLPLGDLRRTAGLRIGFACTGNTCRSPMAEGLARRLLEERLGLESGGRIGDFGFEVVSMGVFASPGAPPSGQAVEVLGERKIDLTPHRSSPATPERLASLDRVYCLTTAHLEALRGILPPGDGRHLQLLDPVGGDVPDPIGGTLEDYRACADRILQAIERLAGGWA